MSSAPGAPTLRGGALLGSGIEMRQCVWMPALSFGTVAAMGRAGLCGDSRSTVAAAVLLVPRVATARLALVQPHVLEIGLFIAVVGQVIPYSFEQVALRTIPAGVFGVLMSLEPAIASVIGYLALHQSPGIHGIVGTLAVVTAGVAVTIVQPAEPVAR